jgi:hypothetical protein
MTDDTSRDRGVLTPADREFLRGEATLESDQSTYDARYRIRRRVRNAVLDFALLFERMEHRDRERVFADDDLDDALVGAIALLYLGVGDGDRSRRATFVEAVHRAERQCGATAVSATFDVERTTASVDGTVEKIAAGAYRDLTEEELRAFAHHCGEREDLDVEELR